MRTKLRSIGLAGIALGVLPFAPAHAEFRRPPVMSATVSCQPSGGRILIAWSGWWSSGGGPETVGVERHGNRIELHWWATNDGIAAATPFFINGAIGELCDGQYEAALVRHNPETGVVDPAEVFATVRVDCSITDFNDDCQVSLQDLFDFITAYLLGDARANVDGSNAVTLDDVFAFLSAYFAA